MAGTRTTRVFGFLGDVAGVLGMALALPIAMLVIGTPLVLVVSLVVRLLERL